MALENASWIYELQKTNPAGTDVISEGDNHLRMIKEVLKDSFPSAFDGAQIPDIDGNDNKLLAVNETGTAIEWVDKYVPPAYPQLQFWRITATDTPVPIVTWTPLNMAHTIVDTGSYILFAGIDRWGTDQFDFKDNKLAVTVNGVRRWSVEQNTSNRQSDYNFLATSNILSLEKDDVIGMEAYQDSGPNTTLMVGSRAYVNILRLS